MMRRLAACCCFCCASESSQAEKAPSSKQKDGENRPAGAELVNDLIKTEWKHVSDWFQDQMSTKVAPIVADLLQKWHPTIGVTIPRDKCTLGMSPPVLDKVRSSKITEVLPDGTPIETMRITSKVDFTSDAEMDFVFENVFGLVGKASMKVDGMRIKGTVIIELVCLSKDPPWFSAVRVYFPDLPLLDFNLEPHVLGTLGENILPLGFIKAKIIMALTENVIGKYAVLPNRFCIPLTNRIEMFSLKHAHPAGVLRVIVEEAENLRNPGSSFWSMRKGEVNASPYVQLWAGSQSSRTCARKEEKTLKPVWKRSGQLYEVHDLFVTEPEMQSLHVRVCDDSHGLRSAEPSPLLGQAETAIREYVKGSKGGRERLQLIASDRGRAGAVWLCIEWRPFASVSAEGIDSPWFADEGGSRDDSWRHGPPAWSRHSLLLSVHLYCGIGLPFPQGEVEMQHHASVSVCAMNTGKYEEQRCIAPAYAVARSPEDHGEHIIKSKCGESGLLLLDYYNRQRLARHLWRTSLSIPLDQQDIDGTDAVWDAPFRFMVDSLENVKVRIVVGTGEPLGKDNKVVLAGELNEANLRETNFGNMEPRCFKFTCNDGGFFTQRESQLNLVVHVRRLQAPVRVEARRIALAKQAFLGHSRGVSAVHNGRVAADTASTSRWRWFPRRAQAAASASSQPLASSREQTHSGSSAIPQRKFWQRRPAPAETDAPADAPGAVPAAAPQNVPDNQSFNNAPLQTHFFASQDMDF